MKIFVLGLVIMMGSENFRTREFASSFATKLNNQYGLVADFRDHEVSTLDPEVRFRLARVREAYFCVRLPEPWFGVTIVDLGVSESSIEYARLWAEQVGPVELVNYYDDEAIRDIQRAMLHSFVTRRLMEGVTHNQMAAKLHWVVMQKIANHLRGAWYGFFP